MYSLKNGFLALVAGTLCCSCTAPSGDGKPQQAAVASPQKAASPVIRQILLEGEGATSNAQSRPPLVTPDTVVSGTVSITRDGAEDPVVSLRLIDLKNGQVVGEQARPVTSGQDSAQFEFKPARPWSEGRHLLEARIQPAGKVFQREFDVVPAEPASAPRPAPAS